MTTDFRTEMGAWKQVFSHRKKTFVFFQLLLLLLMSLFFISVWQLQLFSGQVEQLTGEVELIAEINEGLPESELVLLQQSLEELPGVDAVRYWTLEQVSEYIDSRLFRGYQDFVQKYQLDVPLRPLYRIRLSDLSVRDEVLETLRSRFAAQLLVVDGPRTDQEQSFGVQFVETLKKSMNNTRVLMIGIFLFLVGFYGYTTAFFLSERSRGFHLGQILHLSVPYTFWPALFVSFIDAFVLVCLSLLINMLLLGEWLIVLAGMLLVAFLLVDVVMVWFGRFVVVKWGMR